MADRKMSTVPQSDRLRNGKNLRKLFDMFRGSAAGLDSANFASFAVDCMLVDKAFSQTDATMIFSKVKLGKKTELSFDRFEEAVRQIAVAKNLTFNECIQNCADVKGLSSFACEGNAIVVDVETLTVRQLKAKMEAKGVSYAGCLEKTDLIARYRRTIGAAAHITGLDAMRIYAKKMIEAPEKNEYELEYPKKKSLGISLERANEWGIVKVAPVEVELGSVLVAVNGERVLLKPYNEAMQTLKLNIERAWPLRLRFRRAPSMSGMLLKRSRGRNSQIRSWKNRFFVLKHGVLEYYTKDPLEGGVAKGQYLLQNDPGSQTVVTMAPEAIMGKEGVGIMLVKGDDRLVLKAANFEDLMAWSAKLYVAVAMANGGNTEMCQMENATVAQIESEAAARRWQEESARLRKEQEAALAQYHAREDAKVQAEAEQETNENEGTADTAAAAKKQQELEERQRQLEEQRAAEDKARKEEEQKRQRELQALALKQEEDQAAAIRAAEEAALAQDAAEGIASLTINEIAADDEDDDDDEEEAAFEEKLRDGRAKSILDEQAVKGAIASVQPSDGGNNGPASEGSVEAEAPQKISANDVKPTATTTTTTTTTTTADSSDKVLRAVGLRPPAGYKHKDDKSWFSM